MTHIPAWVRVIINTFVVAVETLVYIVWGCGDGLVRKNTLLYTFFLYLCNVRERVSYSYHYYFISRIHASLFVVIYYYVFRSLNNNFSFLPFLTSHRTLPTID